MFSSLYLNLPDLRYSFGCELIVHTKHTIILQVETDYSLVWRGHSRNTTTTICMEVCLYRKITEILKIY